MTGRILFIENDADFIGTRSEYLEREGYEIIQAHSLSEAEMLFDRGNIHLAIIDIRMKDDNDEMDISGLIFAKKNAFHAVPKIILTGFTSLGYVREVMRPSPVGLPAAIDFIAKQDGPDVLIAAVKRAFDEIVLINWNLKIEWHPHNPFSIVSLLEPKLAGENLISHAAEIEDLFRRLFIERDSIRIERLLWQNNGRVALVVFAFKEGTKFESYIVVCGNNTIANEEARRHDKYSPKAQGSGGTSLVLNKETIHYAACVYALSDNHLEEIKTLKEVYNGGPEKTFNLSVNNLFQDTLQVWHQDKLFNAKAHRPMDLYLDKLFLSKEMLTIETLDNRFKAIEQKAPTLGIRIERLKKDKIMVHYKEQSFTLSNPSIAILKAISAMEFNTAIIVPGFLNGDNILVDDNGRVWLTDFFEAGLAPLLWNFVSLEATIRFDWLDTKVVLRRHEMENSLNGSEFSNPETRDLEPLIRKPVRAIQTIRKQAARTVGRNSISYHQGVLFHALYRFFQYDVRSPLTPSELARYLHILISITTISMLINQGHEDSDDTTLNEKTELHLDVTTNTVMIGERKIRLSPRPFKLLQYLYENSDRVCTTDELRQKVIGENYNTTYIHTLVGRIRDAIENDPEKAHYLVREPNIGYRLIIEPQKEN